MFDEFLKRSINKLHETTRSGRSALPSCADRSQIYLIKSLTRLSEFSLLLILIIGAEFMNNSILDNIGILNKLLVEPF